MLLILINCTNSGNFSLFLESAKCSRRNNMFLEEITIWWVGYKFQITISLHIRSYIHLYMKNWYKLISELIDLRMDHQQVLLPVLNKKIFLKSILEIVLPNKTMGIRIQKARKVLRYFNEGTQWLAADLSNNQVLTAMW